MTRGERACPCPPARPRHGADARPHASAPVHRGGGLRRRRDPRQPDAVARHVRRARPGGGRHLAADAVSGRDQPVHAPPLGAGRRDPDRRGAGSGARQVRHRHRLHVREHDRPQAGESVDFDGTPGRLGYAAKRRIPIVMAASGPKAIELAGEIADGALLLVGFNRGIVEKALEHLERGARRSGRRLDDLEIVWAVRVGVAVTTSEARRLARPTAVHWGVLRWGGHWVEPAGLRLPKLEIPEAVWKIYPDLSHAHDWEAAIAATSFVPDDVVAQLCDAIGLVGTPADCAARIVEMTKLGVRNLYLMPLLTFAPPEREIAAFRDTVFPRLAKAGLRPAS